MFVVFEGIDGSGKTTVSNLVAKGLRGRGISVKHLRAEGKFASAVTEAIRALGRDGRNVDLVPRAEFLLYVARDVQLIEEALRPALATNDVVLADRFLYTAEVLGCHARHLPPDYTVPVLRAAADGLSPDLVILVDTDPSLARARRKAHKLSTNDPRPPSRKGLAGVGIQHRMRRGYLELAESSRDRWVVVENEESLDETVARVTDLVEMAIREGAQPAIARFRAEGSSASAAALGGPLASAEEALQSFLAWLDRRMEREPAVAAYFLSGLAGPGVDERRRALAERAPAGVLAGLTGLTDPASWELRELLRATHPGLVARSLKGVPGTDPRLLALRAALEPESPVEVALSLARLDDAAAWDVRDRLFSRHASAVIRSLKALPSERAWAMRERWLPAHETLFGEDYGLACAAAESVSELDEPRAWRVREAVRSRAPIAALASVEKLVSAPSWTWRERYLLRASKVVMATIRKLDDPRAWEMRRAVVEDCKEAIDSIDELDAEEAWQLREESADRWPSTVVKTLGALAFCPRGRALLERQLRRYPRNLSLLKHASAIALAATGEPRA